MYRSPYCKIRSCFKRPRFSGRRGKACEQDLPSALFVVRSLIEMLFEPVHGSVTGPLQPCSFKPFKQASSP